MTLLIPLKCATCRLFDAFRYKNFKCEQHNRFFEVNLYQKNPLNTHHWRANLARPSRDIDLTFRSKDAETGEKVLQSAEQEHGLQASSPELYGTLSKVSQVGHRNTAKWNEDPIAQTLAILLTWIRLRMSQFFKRVSLPISKILRSSFDSCSPRLRQILVRVASSLFFVSIGPTQNLRLALNSKHFGGTN